MVIGAPVFCIKCGNYHTVDGETMLCEDCYDEYGEFDDDDEDKCECAECGEMEWIEDMIYVQDTDTYVCSNCASRVATFCEKCYTFYSKDRVQYNEELDLDLCERCRESNIPSDISDRDFL